MLSNRQLICPIFHRLLNLINWLKARLRKVRFCCWCRRPWSQSYVHFYYRTHYPNKRTQWLLYHRKIDTCYSCRTFSWSGHVRRRSFVLGFQYSFVPLHLWTFLPITFLFGFSKFSVDLLFWRWSGQLRRSKSLSGLLQAARWTFYPCCTTVVFN